MRPDQPVAHRSTTLHGQRSGVRPVTRHYFDTASTSLLRPLARVAMQRSLDLPSADPGRMHAEGLTVRHQLELARESVANLLGARPREVVFTSSASEAIITAIWGQTTATPGTVVVTAGEHSAVRRAAEHTERSITVPIDAEGLVDPAAFGAAIDAEHRVGRAVSLACCQLGNHEVGSIQPIDDVVRICHARGVPVLVDAAQATGRVAFDFASSGATFAAVSGHKIGGPAGSGALLVKRGVRVDPLVVGGAQERARRAGLENTVAAVGFGAACAELGDTMDAEADVAKAQTDRLRTMFESIEGAEVFGPNDPTRRLPHLVCAGLPDIEPQAIVIALDQAGIAAHSGSSCASEDLEPSPVLAAMGAVADRSLRLSVGWHTSDDALDAACLAVPAAVDQLRTLRSR